MEQRLNTLHQAVIEHFPKNVKISHPAGDISFGWSWNHRLMPVSYTAGPWSRALASRRGECLPRGVSLITVSA